MKYPSSEAQSWALLAAILTLGTALCAVAEAFALEMLVQRPTDGGSLTTLLPGATYASATVMKVSLVGGLLATAIALAMRVRGPGTQTERNNAPALGILSAAMPPLTLLAGAAAVAIAQLLFTAQPLLSDFPSIGRAAVLTMIALLCAGLGSALLGLRKGERPRALVAFAIIVNGVLIGLFWHFQFYALKFDQDTWAQ